MLKKNELRLKKGEKKMYLPINMVRIHVWKAMKNVELRGSAAAPFYQPGAALVCLPSAVDSLILYLTFQEQKAEQNHACFAGDPYF